MLAASTVFYPRKSQNINTHQLGNGPPQNETKNIKQDDQAMLRKIQNLTNNSNVLFKATAVFPFDFFPDNLSVDKNKVNIVYKEFFASEDIHSILIKNIKDIEIETSPFFATIKIVPDGYPASPIRITYLKKKEAIKARRIIQGLMTCYKEGIDLAKIKSNSLIQKIEDLGQTRESTGNI